MKFLKLTAEQPLATSAFSLAVSWGRFLPELGTLEMGPL